MTETFYEVMRKQGITRRSFLKYCSLTAAALGLGPAFVPKIAHAMETKPRIPILWLHGLECTCCSESFIRSAHPLAKDVVLSMVSLDYDDTIMAAAGQQAEAIVQETIDQYDGNYILACEGNPPLNQDGMSCIIEGARKAYCLYKMGCKGPTTYNACSTIRWNDGTSFPIQAGHGCIGCSEDGFWDKGSWYARLTDIKQFGIERNADAVGETAAAIVGAATVGHMAVSAIKRARSSNDNNTEHKGEQE
jgi:Ni,Fe-hydrogenase I small subunit